MNNSLLTRRIWYHYPYVITADMLSAEPTHENDLSSLRDDASCDGHSYLKFTRSFVMALTWHVSLPLQRFCATMATRWCSTILSSLRRVPGMTIL